MCVIVVKPSGIDMPSKETLENCFRRNSDGSGYMFVENNQVHIKKGYMTFNDFYENVMADYNRMGGKQNCFVMHFRIGTQGSNSKELTHPYPVSKNLDELKMTESYTRIGMAHNGIISLTSRRDEKVDRNDTMAYITDYISLFMKTEDDFKDEDKMKVVKNLLGSGNKLAFLMKDHLYMVGEFTEDEDTKCFFSNMYWKPYKFSNNYYSRYNDWDDYDWQYNGGYYGNYKNSGCGFGSSLGKTYNVGKQETKKDESTNEENTKDALEEQQDIADLIKAEEDKQLLYDDEMEAYYDEVYDEKDGLYYFDCNDCPYMWEKRLDFCDKTVCALAKRCPYYKQNMKEKKRRIKLARKRQREALRNVIPFKKKEKENE